MALKEDDKIQSSPRASKDPKSYEYARQMVYVLKTVWGRVSFDIKHWEKELEEAKKNQIWLRHKPSYGSLEELLEKEVGYSKAEENAKVQMARDNPSPPADQKEAPRNPNGRKGKESDNNVIRLRQGNDTTYTLRRLARDNPELLDKIEAGELTVNAAAIQAGIRKKPTPEQQCLRGFKKSSSRLDVIRRVIDELQPHELVVVRDWIEMKLKN
jgi:hypothetical protein